MKNFLDSKAVNKFSCPVCKGSTFDVVKNDVFGTMRWETRQGDNGKKITEAVWWILGDVLTVQVMCQQNLEIYCTLC